MGGNGSAALLDFEIVIVMLYSPQLVPIAPSNGVFVIRLTYVINISLCRSINTIATQFHATLQGAAHIGGTGDGVISKHSGGLDIGGGQRFILNGAPFTKDIKITATIFILINSGLVLAGEPVVPQIIGRIISSIAIGRRVTHRAIPINR